MAYDHQPFCDCYACKDERSQACRARESEQRARRDAELAAESEAIRTERAHELRCVVLKELVKHRLSGVGGGDPTRVDVEAHTKIAHAYADASYPPPKAGEP